MGRSQLTFLIWIRYRWSYCVIALAILLGLSGCVGISGEKNEPTIVATDTRGAAGSPISSPTAPVITDTPLVGAMASAAPLPTRSIPQQPIPVASEIARPTQTNQDGAFSNLPPTPQCAGLSPTLADTEGPYFLAGSPERSTLIETGMSGTRLTITGYVVNTKCEPIEGAQIEFWQAGPDGQYDLTGYRFRGHLFTDARGFYRMETLMPAAYESRPRHIHIKILPQNSPGLTTQLYFPGDSVTPELTVAFDETIEGALAVFNFVLP